ncbi:MAG TPA: outer membrane beta-barrel protein [Edaphobacter sp.]
MSIASRPLRLWSLVVCFFAALSASSAHAQATSGNPALEKQLSRIDLGIGAMGTITKDVQGTNYLNADIKQEASKTVGALITIRYTVSPYLGGEFNYSYARFTQHFRDSASGQDLYLIGGIQANASEYSFGYVAHPPHAILGAKPFLSAGLGTTAFRPTPGGGQSLFSRARMTYYYSAGLEKNLNNHFGLRASFRQTFYKAPDFGVNYLELQKRTWTVEPTVGFVIHF